LKVRGRERHFSHGEQKEDRSIFPRGEKALPGGGDCAHRGGPIVQEER